MIKVNVGCWKRDFGPDWFHIDGCYLPHIDSHDIVNLPFEDGTVSLIYASHVLEYFDRAEALEVLKKWYAKLRDGGMLRVSVPDFLKLMWIYQDSHDLDTILGPLYGKMVMNNKFIYHKTCYDFKSLEALLRSAKFLNIKPYDFRNTQHSQYDDHSKAHYPHDREAIRTGIFTSKHIQVSLNIECIK